MARSFSSLVRYEVVQRNWLIYLVHRVETITATAAPPSVHRHTVRWFLKLDRAEACAQGLAEDTWTEEGPILAVYEPLTEENND
jgi:hypothetical protein